MSTEPLTSSPFSSVTLVMVTSGGDAPYALRQRAHELGWHESDVDVIDADLGLRRASVVQRSAFKETDSGSGANFWFEVNRTDALRIDHAASTAFQIAGAVLACFGNVPRLNWFLRMRWSSSMPAIVTLAR